MLFTSNTYDILGKNKNLLEITLQVAGELILDGNCIVWADTEIEMNSLPTDGYENSHIPENEDFMEDIPEPEEEKQQEIPRLEEDAYTPEEEETPEIYDKIAAEVEKKNLVEKLWGAMKKSFVKATQMNKNKEEAGAEEDSTTTTLEAPEPPQINPVLDESQFYLEQEIPNEPTFVYPFTFTHCLNKDPHHRRKIALMSSKGGEIFRLDLVSLDNHELIIQAGSFLCAEKGLKVELFLQHKTIVCQDTQQPFTLQKLIGEKLIFLQTSNELIERELDNDAIRANLACVVAFENSIEIDMDKIDIVQDVFQNKSTYMVILAGTGKVWLQNQPLYQLNEPQKEPTKQTEMKAVGDLPPPIIFEQSTEDKPEKDAPTQTLRQDIPSFYAADTPKNSVEEEFDLDLDNLEDLIKTVKEDLPHQADED